jgi:hypothetical protein
MKKLLIRIIDFPINHPDAAWKVSMTISIIAVIVAAFPLILRLLIWVLT